MVWVKKKIGLAAGAAGGGFGSSLNIYHGRNIED